VAQWHQVCLPFGSSQLQAWEVTFPCGNGGADYGLHIACKDELLTPPSLWGQGMDLHLCIPNSRPHFFFLNAPEEMVLIPEMLNYGTYSRSSFL